MQSIKDIKAYLKTVDRLSEQEISQFKADPRKGVQQAFLQYHKRQEQHMQLVQKCIEMSVFEQEARQKGAQYIAGIDEVGRGPLAGPVVAAAVILPENHGIIGLDDSKKLSEAKRLALYEQIQACALAIGVGEVSPKVIDEINIYEASKRAMYAAIEQLTLTPDYLLIDAMKLDVAIPQEKIIKGDARSVSIAAASIVAKTIRDQQMSDYSQCYPEYDFEHNAGYGTAKHLTALETYGITPIHRKTFAPVKKYC